MIEKQELFSNSWVNITTDGKRHLGAVIRNAEYHDEYVKDLVKDWDNQVAISSTIAKTQPQAAFSAFVSGSENNLNYFLRTISNIRH